MSQEIRLATFRFKGAGAVVALVVIVLGSIAFNSFRVSSLHAEGRSQVEDYLEMELPSRLVRERGARHVTSRDLESAKSFEITEFSTSWIPRDTTRVRVVVRVDGEDLTYYFRFRRALGSWSLRGETRGPLLSH